MGTVKPIKSASVGSVASRLITFDDGVVDLEWTAGFRANWDGPKVDSWVARSSAGECAVPLLNVPMLRRGVEVEHSDGPAELRSSGKTGFGRRLVLTAPVGEVVLERTGWVSWRLIDGDRLIFERRGRSVEVDVATPLQVATVASLIWFAGLPGTASWWHYSNNFMGNWWY